MCSLVMEWKCAMSQDRDGVSLNYLQSDGVSSFVSNRNIAGWRWNQLVPSAVRWIISSSFIDGSSLRHIDGSSLRYLLVRCIISSSYFISSSYAFNSILHCVVLKNRHKAGTILYSDINLAREDIKCIQICFAWQCIRNLTCCPWMHDTICIIPSLLALFQHLTLENHTCMPGSSFCSTNTPNTYKIASQLLALFQSLYNDASQLFSLWSAVALEADRDIVGNNQNRHKIARCVKRRDA